MHIGTERKWRKSSAYSVLRWKS